MKQEMKINIVRGKSIDQYMRRYGKEYEEGTLWDFSIEDMRNGAIEPTEGMVYWLIDDRLYETC